MSAKRPELPVAGSVRTINLSSLLGPRGEGTTESSSDARWHSDKAVARTVRRNLKELAITERSELAGRTVFSFAEL